MTYEITCDCCGAVSPGGSQVCPYCKTLLHAPAPASADATSAPRTAGLASSPALTAPVGALYREGRVDRALGLLNTVVKQHPELQQDPEVLLLNVKLLLETEGSVTQMKALLERGFTLEPRHPKLVEYLEIVEAKGVLDHGIKTKAEELLRKAVQKYPKNEHAQLLLGTHLFWSRGDIHAARRALENCVAIRPVMLRAWACLGAVYSTLGREAIAAQAFRKCLELETHPKMIAYFQSFLRK